MSLYKPLQANLEYFAKTVLIVLVSLTMFWGSAAAATIGVGVGTGKIKLDDPVKPSLSYDLPSIAVFNNGEVESDYEVGVEYNETQQEQKPSAKWFTFSPQRFTLSPGKSQQVNVTLKPEYSAKPGDYFAYLEARPTRKDESGTTAIKIAAATKLYFKVIPANTLQRIYYAILNFWNEHKPQIIVAAGTMLIGMTVLLGKKFLRIEVRGRK